MPSNQAYICVTNDGSQINIFLNAQLIHSRAANEEWSVDFRAEADNGVFEGRVDEPVEDDKITVHLTEKQAREYLRTLEEGWGLLGTPEPANQIRAALQR